VTDKGFSPDEMICPFMFMKAASTLTGMDPESSVCPKEEKTGQRIKNEKRAFLIIQSG